VKICVSIGETSAAAVLERLGSGATADLFEIRFDHLPDDERDRLVELLADADLRAKIIATLRPVAEGGLSRLSREERIAFFSRINGYYACDLEEDIADIAPATQKKIVSFHNHSGVPDDLEQIFDRLVSYRPDIVKIACSVNDAVDAVPIWKLLTRKDRYKVEVVPIAMGEAGKWTRILGPAFGAPISYAAANKGKATAAGQFSMSELENRFRIRGITPDTSIFGVIGDPVTSSLSPAMHNSAYAAKGDDAVFIPFQVKNVEAFFRRMVRHKSREVELNFRGFAVTMPHKLTVIPLLDEIDDAASEIGAVNTVDFSDGKLTGRNTDAAGFLAPITNRFGDISGMRFAVIGAGGAARACIYALKRAGAEAVVFARCTSKAYAEFFNLGVAVERFNAQTSFAGFDIVVNATPVGMKGEILLSAEQLPDVRCVYDLVTGETPLTSDAHARGIEVIKGREMLLEQGILQYEIWMKKAAPREAMRRALDEVC
jgi:3-dehydroquinate dehydratase/shikimate dehydrogenase